MAKPGKPKVAFYWCASCGGCEEAVVDLAEDILKVVEAVELAFWPVALDFKREDVEKLADGSLAAAFINGSIRLSEHEEMAHLLRRKAQVLIAYGSCAHLGGVPGLANLHDRGSIFQYVYKDAPSVSNPAGIYPQERFSANEGELELPAFFDTVKALDQVVEVDYYVPGCPPTPKVTLAAIEALFGGELPPQKGTVLGAGTRALCHECPLNETKPEKLLLDGFKRVHEAIPEPNKCLLAQGFLCLGPATREGCGALCISANMPCTGCFGPLDRVRDFGAKALSEVASILNLNDEQEIEKALERMVDPVGTFYRYSLPRSFLKRRIKR
ncbi:MAG: oxidoreductase [Candidatus Bipolaricaulia bacterium]